MLHNWCISPGIIPSGNIDTLVDFVEKNYEFTEGLINGLEGKQEHRTSDIAWIGHQAGDNFIRDIIWSYIQEANRQAFNFDIQCIPNIQYTVYKGEYKGHYDWHTDMSFVSPALYCRKLSFILQLSDSDEYEGGDFLVEDCYKGDGFKPEDVRTKGTIIIFPSFIKHKVTPVTKGIRRSLVAWAEGPQFR